MLLFDVNCEDPRALDDSRRFPAAGLDCICVYTCVCDHLAKRTCTVSIMAHSGGGWVGKGIDAALGINLDDSTPSPSTSPTRAAPAPLLLYQSQNPSLVSFVTVQAAQPCQGYAGHLSLHEYRKYLSQPDDSTTSSELRGRTLKRKAGTLNLSQARGRRDFSSSISSSFSSVPPSSPPPLSFSQSLQSVTSNVSDPEPEILAGLSHLGQTRSKSISTISSPVSLGQRSDISLPIVMHHEQTSRTHVSATVFATCLLWFA